MCHRLIISFYTVFVFLCSLTGQANTSEQVFYPGGISLQYGIGSYALRDNYISPERYEGILPYYAFGWTRSHDKYVYKLCFAFSQSENISNYSVSTHVLQYRLSQGFLYPLKALKILKKDLGLWIGPTTDFFYYSNSPEIAVSGFDYSDSYAILWSLGFRSNAFFPLSKKISLESSLQCSVLSVGQRNVDNEREDQSEVKALALVSGLNGTFDLGVYFDLVKWLSMGLSYRFELTRITAWEDVLSVSNSVVFGLHFKF